MLNSLSAKVTRNVGRKALELGGNAVLGFKQAFDLEGEIGIVARASGTAVTIRRIGATLASGGSSATSGSAPAGHTSSRDHSHAHTHSHAHSSSLPSSGGADASSTKLDLAGLSVPEEPADSVAARLNRTADEEDESTAVVVVESHDAAERKAASAQVLDPSTISSMLDHAHHSIRPSSTALTPAADARNAMSRHEYRREVHLLTLTSFPSTVQMCLGGIVCARAVKLLDASRSAGGQRAHDRCQPPRHE